MRSGKVEKRQRERESLISFPNTFELGQNCTQNFTLLKCFLYILYNDNNNNSSNDFHEKCRQNCRATLMARSFLLMPTPAQKASATQTPLSTRSSSKTKLERGSFDNVCVCVWVKG